MEFLQTITDLPWLYSLLGRLVRILMVLMGALVLTKLIHNWVPRLRLRLIATMARRTGPDLELEKRAATISGIVRKSVSAVVWIIATVMALREAGFDVGPILAGAGVIGLAIGFGAQNLVKDVISGIFLLLENQVRVNDVAIINGTGGLVEAINLRTIVLRGLDGTVHIFPNGSINSLSNMTSSYSYYVLDIGVGYKEDTDRVGEVLRSIAQEMMKEKEYGPFILEPLELLGVDRFADSAVVVKARIKTAPIKQWLIGREMNRRIKKRFDELGIQIPYPQMNIYVGDGSQPLAVSLRDEDRTLLKNLIREALEEGKIRR